MMDFFANYPWAADVILAAVFLSAACIKGAKGLYKMLMPALVMILSLICATILSSVLTKPVTDFVYPMVEDQVIAKLDLENLSQEKAEKMLSRIQDEADLSEFVENFLPEKTVSDAQKMGVNIKKFMQKTAKKLRENDSFVFDLTEKQIEKLEQAGIEVKESVGAATTQTALKAEGALLSVTFTLARRLTETAVHYILWIILAIVFMLIFTVLKNAMNLVFELPVIGWVDKLGGALVGIAECALGVLVVCWLLRLFGVTALQELAEGTKLLIWFA